MHKLPPSTFLRKTGRAPGHRASDKGASRTWGPGASDLSGGIVRVRAQLEAWILFQLHGKPVGRSQRQGLLQEKQPQISVHSGLLALPPAFPPLAWLRSPGCSHLRHLQGRAQLTGEVSSGL